MLCKMEMLLNLDLMSKKQQTAAFNTATLLCSVTYMLLAMTALNSVIAPIKTPANIAARPSDTAI